jgi:hypothetical protein
MFLDKQKIKGVNMKKIITASLVASLALTSVAGASSLSAQLNSLEAELADVKKQLEKQNKKINKVRAHDAGDNIKWGVDLRTGMDNINYDLADGTSAGNDALMSLRLWLNMAYAPDSHNIFKGRLSMNKALGADFGYPGRAHGLGQMFDWTGNAALADNNLKVSEAYWLYLGDNAFGADIPWTFSLGRRPSTSGFLANLREDDPAASPLGHIINVEFDGFSSKLDFSNVTGIPGMTFKLCMGRGSTSATPLFETATPYADDTLDNIDMAGFIFEPYNDGQYIVKTTWFKAFNLPGMDVVQDMSGNPMNPSLALSPSEFKQYGDIQGAAISVLVDGLTDDGYLADAKVFGSFAWSKTEPETGSMMLGSADDESGTSYWFGAQLPAGDKGTFGLEFNHGSEYWRPFTYAEDTMIGSKLAARGDAWETYFTYQLTDALSAQVRYTDITYDYTGSNGFFGNYSGSSMKIDDIKAGAAGFYAMGGTTDENGAHNIGVVTGALMAQGVPAAQAQQMAGEMAGAAIFAPNVVEAAQDFRFYLRYRF